MRIWVDGQCFQTASKTRGIGRYVADLLRAIDQSGKAQLIISLNGNMKEDAVAARNYLKRLVPGAEIRIWYGLAASSEFHLGYSLERMTDEKVLVAHVNAIAPDVALSPSPFEGSNDRASPFLRTEGIEALTACIFHDAIPYRFPDQYLPNESTQRTYYRRFDRIGKFDYVLCNSDFTNSEYKAIFKRGNSATISAGLSESFTDLLESWVSNPSSRSASIGDYVLYVGGLDWRKNVATLVRAMSRVPECIAGDLKLVLAGDLGDKGELADPLRALWKDCGLNPANLVATGWISDEELVDLYRNATVAVQPSFMEGFGLTALEAMAAGCPIICARGGASAEVVSSKDLLFDPELPPQLSRLISRILNDKPFRERMVTFGLKRVKAFSWDKAATITLDALERAMKAIGHAHRAAPEPLTEPQPPRLVMDVTSTAQSAVMSGIQRVMHKLSNAMVDLNQTDPHQVVLSYCRDEQGWYELDRLGKSSVLLDPRRRIPFHDQDTYFLLDSSWTFTDGQRRRLLDALVMGQEVIHGIHDIGPLTMSAMTDKGMPLAFRAWFEFVLGHSTGIVCVSRAVADEIYELLQKIELPRPMKVGYFHLGADFSDALPDYSQLAFIAERPTFLMVGTIEPRKGHAIALQAFERLWAEGVDVNLLIIGNTGWDTRLLRARLDAHRESERRLFVRSGLDDRALRAAYSDATALIMTSYLEGFGLPVVEAGRLGCPVILSDIPVFREIGSSAPAARYFRMGDPVELAAVVREVVDDGFGKLSRNRRAWPSWSDSAQQVKSLLFGGEWYRHYEPREILPNTKLSDIGNVVMAGPLLAEDRKYTIRAVEGPLLSDDGTEAYFVLALRNDSTKIWSSYNRDRADQFAINVGSHVYSRNGKCLDYENPRTRIPFVLYPGQEIYLPVRVSTDWYTRDATSLGIELVQEGVSWFGEAFRLNLLQPANSNTTELEGEPAELRPMFFRGPFGRDMETDQYFLFAMLNTSQGMIRFEDADGRAQIEASLHDAYGASISGSWIVNAFDAIAPDSYGFICVYASGPVMKERAAALVLTLDGNEPVHWRLDLKTLEFERMAASTMATPEDDEPAAEALSPETDGQTGNGTIERAALRFARSERALVTRGFHPFEDGHAWIDGRVADVDLSDFIPDVRKLRRIELTCAAVKGLPETMQVRVALAERALGTLTISTNFMTHGIDIDAALAKDLTNTNRRLRLVASESRIEDGGFRDLSICLTKIEILAMN